MFLLIILLSSIQAAYPRCRWKNTDYYLRIPHQDENFFDKTTYTYDNPCVKITNTEFRKRFPKYRGKYSYDVEHIIDNKNGPKELETCDKDILGNKLMAIATWNGEVGQLCWNDVKYEKQAVYGGIFQSAYDSVKHCCQAPEPSPESMPEDPADGSKVFMILLVILAIIFATLVSFNMLHMLRSRVSEEAADSEL